MIGCVSGGLQVSPLSHQLAKQIKKKEKNGKVPLPISPPNVLPFLRRNQINAPKDSSRDAPRVAIVNNKEQNSQKRSLE